MTGHLTNEEARAYWMDVADELSDANRRLRHVALAAHEATMKPGDAEAWDALCVACEEISDEELNILRAPD